MPIKIIRAAEAKTLIETSLAEAFPDTTFTVAQRQRQLGCDIAVGWRGGPLETEVEEIVGRFAGIVRDRARVHELDREPVLLLTARLIYERENVVTPTHRRRHSETAARVSVAGML